MVDMVVPRKELRQRLVTIFDLLRRPGPKAELVRLTENAKPAKEAK